MKSEYRLLLQLCGFAVIVAFIAFMLAPSIVGLRSSQMDLQSLETRVRLVPEVDAPYHEACGRLRILDWDELFAALADVRAGASMHGFDMASFTVSEVDSFGLDVNEAEVRASFSGCFDDAVSYAFYLAGGVFNVRYLSIVTSETTSIDVLISVFYMH